MPLPPSCHKKKKKEKQKKKNSPNVNAIQKTHMPETKNDKTTPRHTGPSASAAAENSPAAA
jgi:hypothetical protein